MLALILLGTLWCLVPESTTTRGEPLNLTDFSKWYGYDEDHPLNVVEITIKESSGHKVLKVYLDSANGERVPGLVSIPRGYSKVPCIVFLHGYGGKKEAILAVAEFIAGEGYAIMSIDAEYHGERREGGRSRTHPISQIPLEG